MKLTKIIAAGLSALMCFPLFAACGEQTETVYQAATELSYYDGTHYEELADPNMLMFDTFRPWWVTVLYIIWFAALWFHLTHGFWSAFHTLGWNNNIWIKRLKVISYIVATLIFAVFALVAIVACLRANGIVPIPVA